MSEWVFAGRILNKAGGKRVCGGFLSKHAHDQQERLELSRIGIRKGPQKSPATVVGASGEVLTKEEATVYLRELDLFVMQYGELRTIHCPWSIDKLFKLIFQLHLLHFHHRKP